MCLALSPLSVREFSLVLYFSYQSKIFQRGMSWVRAWESLMFCSPGFGFIRPDFDSDVLAFPSDKNGWLLSPAARLSFWWSSGMWLRCLRLFSWCWIFGLVVCVALSTKATADFHRVFSRLCLIYFSSLFNWFSVHPPMMFGGFGLIVFQLNPFYEA